MIFWFIDCSPTSPRNGYIQEKRFEDKKYFKIGEEINYFCDVGYSKKGVSTKKCTTYGRLIPDSSFKCIPGCFINTKLHKSTTIFELIFFSIIIINIISKYF